MTMTSVPYTPSIVQDVPPVIGQTDLERILRGTQDLARARTTPWINLQLSGGWVNFDSGVTLGGVGRACQYRKLNGLVLFRGVMRSGPNSVNFGFVPPGFRPANGGAGGGDHCQVMVTNGGGVQIVVDYLGNLVIGNPFAGSANSFTYLTGLVYPAEA